MRYAKSSRNNSKLASLMPVVLMNLNKNAMSSPKKSVTTKPKSHLSKKSHKGSLLNILATEKKLRSKSPNLNSLTRTCTGSRLKMKS